MTDTLDPKTLGKLPSPFYRVTVKAIIKNDRDEVLIMRNDRGAYELPGGGLEHGESFDECIRRELHEELGVAPEHIGAPTFSWMHPHRNWGYMILRIAAPVELENYEFTPGDGMIEGRFVSRDEFLGLNLEEFEGTVKEQEHMIWPTERTTHD